MNEPKGISEALPAIQSEYERLKQERMVGDACPDCGDDNWRIDATAIECASCEAEWGRVNGEWVRVR